MTPAFRIVLLVSAVLKIGLALLVGETAPRYDETEYVEFGREIYEEGAEPRLWRAPMEQWIVAGGMALTGGKLVGGRLIGAVLSVLTVWLVYRAARRVAGERAAFWAATLLAFYPSHVAFSHWFWSETVYMFFTALALERLLAADAGGGPADDGARAAGAGSGWVGGQAIAAAAVAGAACGGAALSRSLGLVMLALAAAWLTLGRGRRGFALAVVAVVAAAVVVAPYSFRASQRAETLVLTDVNGPFNFWSGNNRYIPDDVGMIWALGLPLENGLAPRFLAYYPDDEFRREVPLRLGEAGVTDAQGPDGAAWYRREAWESISEEPLGVLRRAPKKLAALWGPDMFLPRYLLRDWYGELSPWLAGGVTILTWLAAAIALIAGAAAMAALRPSRFRTLAWAWTAAYVVLHAVAYGHTRMHQPLIPLLLISLFAFFLDRDDPPDRARLLRRGAPPAALAVAAWVAVWPLLGGLYVYPGPRHAAMARFLAIGHDLPLPGAQRQVWSLATVEASLDRNEEAVALLDQSRHGDLAWSWLLRALMTTDRDEARRCVDRALEREPYLEPAEILKRQLEASAR
ncbi:MAG TPA: glycosyltransferase family 39 protein [bacterium]|nr:glycosyltransferase family 39 protein [bacterium]